ncbi:MAG: hypothetical protein HYT79_10850 [Elusimicrobia bacterium]|nr:hypothetical protein [Elusimicrobiota bacterium]
MTICINSLATASFLYAEPGRTAAQFLVRDTGTRALALGGAFTAAWGDIESIGYNPAGVGTITNTQIDLMYSRGFAGDNFGSMNLGLPQLHPVHFGLGATHYDAGSIDLNLSGGLQEKRKAEQDWAFTGTMALELTSVVSVGASAKSFRSTLAEEYDAQGTAFDAGLLMRLPLGGRLGHLYAGGSLMNQGDEITFHKEKDPLPTKRAGGLAWRFGGQSQEGMGDEPGRWEVLMLGDVSQVKHEKKIASLGLEVTQFNLFGSETIASLRGGYRSEAQTPSTHVGFGWGQELWLLNYALVFHKTGLRHQMSMSWKL